MSENYLMGEILRNTFSESLFFNSLEKIERHEDERFVHSLENKITKYKNMPEVEYLFNTMGFRSDEFKTDHKKEHILFAGCSETEGVGGNLDSCWSYMLYSEMLKEKDLSGFFNIGRSGWGYDRIISNIMSYINSYGKPDKIFILFPNLGRFYGWDKSKSKYSEMFVYKSSIPPNVDSSQKEIYPDTKKDLAIEEHRRNFISFTMIMRIFEEYCISSGIKLFWSTWNRYDSQNLEKVSIFKNYVPMDSRSFFKENEDYLLGISKDREDWGSKRDGHAGYLLHLSWSKRFFEHLSLTK